MTGVKLRAHASMTDHSRRFCPRCGGALVAGLPFCPACGLNTAKVGDSTAVPPNDQATAPAEIGLSTPFGRSLPEETQVESATDDAESSGGAAISPRARRLLDRVSRAPSVVIAAVIVAAGLVIFGLLMRPQPGSGPAALPGGQPPAGGAPVAPSALIVGLTIMSPRDGEVVATEDVTVIGLAPPGVKITRDVSFGLDQHATTDGTGHWAIGVGLNKGENKLKFRIGDDRSTEQEIRVTYTPPTQ